MAKLLSVVSSHCPPYPSSPGPPFLNAETRKLRSIRTVPAEGCRPGERLRPSAILSTRDFEHTLTSVFALVPRTVYLSRFFDLQELEQERAKLEKDKTKFLEEAVRRDSKSFVFSYPSASPTPTTPARRDSRYYSNPLVALGLVVAVLL